MLGKKGWSALLAVMLTATVLGACSDNGKDNGGTPANTPAPSATTTDSGEASPAGDADPFGKIDPPVTMTSVLATAGWATFPDGETWDNDNRWTKLYRETLGVNLKWNWMVDSTQYDNKMNVTIASGDIPDLMLVSKKQLNQLVEADMVEDLTDVFDRYAMPYLKEQVAEALAPAQKMATYDGRLMAIPQYGGDPRDSLLTLYVRSDWLQKLNLPEPKTIDELVQVADAFVKQDPDGNGKPDTLGLGILSATMGGGSIGGFLNGFHAYPDIWIEDGSGRLAYGSIAPQMKDALAKLQQMYKDGLIDREFGTKDYNRLKEDVVSGKLGIFYGTISESALIAADLIKNDPNASWIALPLPSIDGTPAKPSVGVSVGGFHVVKKGFSNPEAAVKMMNLFVRKVYGDDELGTNGDNKQYAWVDNAKYAMHVLSPIQGYIKDYNYRLVRDALASGDPSALNESLKDTYDLVKGTDGSDPEKWQQWWIHQPAVSPFEVRDRYQLQPDGVVIDKYFGGSTKTADEKMSTLGKMQNETFVKIVMNAAPIDDFDSFVTNWKKLGGDQITQEVNEWYASNK
ncbi:extracellular solute-binding protein [Cohnella phaseoli]|uniref:Putative aldouronate transport system substrate-binding protein n=1 Tax=Cohnella phaseoli TaxID=456490 RepID=A0A3D9HT18_9BACL|nr:extracellular solute-binding protein [Cohnella phaseoli]RED52644.1 putative aldouronate transport system substrate-binding protein [Cohnella phaseoli]